MRPLTNRKLRDAPLAALTLTALLLGCDAGHNAGTSAGVTVRDSAGVAIIEHTAEYIQTLPVWTIDSTPLVRITGDTPGAEFTEILHVRRRPDGRFVVVDQRLRDIRE